jgi:hypothetical protein
MTGFLSAADITQMRKDFSDLLSGPEGTPITIRYRASVSGATWDDTYQEWVGGVETYADISTRSIQQLVDERDKDLLEFAFVKSGDCVFSILSSVDLDGKEKITIIDPDGGVWVPVIVPTRAFYEYIDVRVGSTQIAQSLLTRLQQ